MRDNAEVFQSGDNRGIAPDQRYKLGRRQPADTKASKPRSRPFVDQSSRVQQVPVGNETDRVREVLIGQCLRLIG
jgi:hypothetical protein